MSEDRSRMMFDILRGIRGVLGRVRRAISPVNLRVSALEDHFPRRPTTPCGIEADVSRSEPKRCIAEMRGALFAPMKGAE